MKPYGLLLLVGLAGCSTRHSDLWEEVRWLHAGRVWKPEYAEVTEMVESNTEWTKYALKPNSLFGYYAGFYTVKHDTIVAVWR